MTVAWGPFARQCTETRTSNDSVVGHSGPSEAATDHQSCTGFSAAPASLGAIEITASTTGGGQSTTPVIARFLRGPGGVSRPAAQGDTDLLAQGSDSPALAEAFAREIGVTHQQVIDPDATLRLPIRLQTEFPIEGMLSCRPDGGNVDHGRETLVFTCTLDDTVHTRHLDARVELAGVEEIDVLTGVRLASALAGSMTGHERSNPQARWQPIDDHVWFRRTTEFQ